MAGGEVDAGAGANAGGSAMPAAAATRPRPWLSIWIRPRATMRGILERGPDPVAIALLAMIGGIAHTLDRASMRDAGDKLPLPAILGGALVAGPLAGLLQLYLGALLLGVTGRWLGGRAPRAHLRAAIGWANVPSIVSLALWLPALALFGSDLFTSEMPRIDAVPALAGPLLAWGAADLGIGIWQGVIALKCIGEAHGFSAWRALASAVLAVLLVVVPLGLLAGLLYLLLR